MHMSEAQTHTPENLPDPSKLQPIADKLEDLLEGLGLQIFEPTEDEQHKFNIGAVGSIAAHFDLVEDGAVIGTVGVDHDVLEGYDLFNLTILRDNSAESTEQRTIRDQIMLALQLDENGVVRHFDYDEHKNIFEFGRGIKPATHQIFNGTDLDDPAEIEKRSKEYSKMRKDYVDGNFADLEPKLDMAKINEILAMLMHIDPDSRVKTEGLFI